jgi:uncharacterized protein (TIGR02145 family)
MKTLSTTLIILILCAMMLNAQPPQAFNYQAVARDYAGNILSGQNVSFRISILMDNINGTAVYIEIHETVTNEFGLVNLEIGNGSDISGVFDEIGWGSRLYFLQIELGENGGSNFQYMGTSQLLSVPYALNAGSLTLTSPNGTIFEITVDTAGNLITNLATMPCPGIPSFEYGGQIYTTIQIGAQCWMAENLNIGTMINGSINQTQNSPTEIIEKYCYDDNTSNCDTYGGLYQWDEMMQYVTTEGTQGICPTGWHLPTDAEWCTLENHVDAVTVSCSAIGWRGTDAGGNLKEIGTSHWTSPNSGATNTSGFTGLPGGYRYTDGLFFTLSYYAYFWSSSENGSDAWYRYLSYNNAQVIRGYSYQAYGFSVRCVRD